MSYNYQIRAFKTNKIDFDKLRDCSRLLGEPEEITEADLKRFLLRLALKQVQNVILEIGEDKINRQILEERFRIKW